MLGGSDVIDEQEQLPVDIVEDGHNAKSGFLNKRSHIFQTMPCLGTTYKRRFVALRGKYLFRFASEHSRKAKGVPLDLEMFTLRISDEKEDSEGKILPFAFILESIPKIYVFSAETAAEREEWCEAVAAAKQLAVKQRLGHAPIESWEKQTNVIGEKLVHEKERREELERTIEQPNVVY